MAQCARSCLTMHGCNVHVCFSPYLQPMMGIYGVVVVIARRGSLKFSLRDGRDDGYSNLESGGGGQGGSS